MTTEVIPNVGDEPSENVDSETKSISDEIAIEASSDNASEQDDEEHDNHSIQQLAHLETIREGEIWDLPPDFLQFPHGNQRKDTPQVVISSPDDFGGRIRTVSFAQDEGELETNGGVTSGHYLPQDADDDNDSLLSLPAELPSPPDGGWGWIIVGASFLCNMIVDGVCYSFSPFLDAFSEYFDEPKGKVAWISSLLAGVYLSAGPIVSALSNKYGCRVVCVSGALISGLAYGASVFATSVPFLMITQGVIAGFGFGLMYLPAVVMTGYYFESKRALATGIAVCGSGVGTMVFPPLMHFLIQQFGWRGTNLIIAGMILNGCWIGGLMRPLTVKKMKKKDLLHRIAEEKKHAMEIGSFYGSNYMNVTDQDGTVIKKVKPGKIMNPDPGVHSHLNLSGYFTPSGTYNALPTIDEGESDKKSQTTHTDSKSKLKPTAEESLSTTKLAKVPVVRKGSDGVQVSQEANGQHMAKVRKITSTPDFERRLSKIDMLSHLKVVPATPQASYANLRGLGSQDMSRNSSGYRKVTSTASFVDSERGVRQRRPSREKKETMLRPMSRQDIFYSGSIRNLQEFKSQNSMLTYRESTLNLQGTGASRAVIDVLDGVEPHDEKGGCCPDSVTGILTQMMDFSLLKNPTFLLIGIANLIGMLGFYTPFVYLPAAAIEKGIEPDSATFLVSIIGITNTVGRVLSGLIADIPCVNALHVNNFCLVMSGVCVFVTPLATSYAAFVVIAIAFGFFVSAFIALTSIIVVELLGVKQLTSAFGLLCVFRGFAGILSHPISAAYISLTSIILVELLGLGCLTNAFGLLILFRGSASLVGPPLAGSIYDATQSYDISFTVSGILLFACAFCHFIIPCVQRWCVCYEGPVRYTTNEEYLQGIPEEDEDKSVGNVSPDAAEGAGIVLNIKPKDWIQTSETTNANATSEV